MKPRQTPRCFACVQRKGQSAKTYLLHFQVPSLTITLAAHSLSFAAKAIKFIETTRNNPKFRDKHLGGGVYRHMPQKRVDLSASFVRTKVTIHKYGEFDDRYFIRVTSSPTNTLVIAVGGEQLDAFLGSLREIIDDHLGGSRSVVRSGLPYPAHPVTSRITRATSSSLRPGCSGNDSTSAQACSVCGSDTDASW
jgi:hypothetical protein